MKLVHVRRLLDYAAESPAVGIKSEEKGKHRERVMRDANECRRFGMEMLPELQDDLEKVYAEFEKETGMGRAFPEDS